MHAVHTGMVRMPGCHIQLHASHPSPSPAHRHPLKLHCKKHPCGLEHATHTPNSPCRTIMWTCCAGEEAGKVTCGSLSYSHIQGTALM